MKINKIFIILCATFLMGGVAWAQDPTKSVVESIGKVQKTVQRASSNSLKKGLRAGGQAYIIPNVNAFKKPLTKFEEDLAVKKYRHNYLSTVQNLHYKLSSSYANQIREQVGEDIYPGHVDNFPVRWAERERFTDQLSLSNWETVLRDAYGGEGARFSGHFVPTFREVLALQEVSNLEWTPVAQALEKAFGEAQTVKSGFFVLVVKETPEYEKDVLILDLDQRKFVSINKSREAKAIQEQEAVKPRPNCVVRSLDGTIMEFDD